MQFVTLPRCPDVNANHPIERNYGNSVRFLAKIPNGTAAESPFYSVFWNAIDFCRVYTSQKISITANRPAFCRQVPLFYAKCPSKNIFQVDRSGICRQESSVNRSTKEEEERKGKEERELVIFLTVPHSLFLMIL